MSSMFNPPHPGLTLRDDILPALNLQVGEAAAQLGVDRTTLSKVVNGRAAISPSMALRIERWLGRDHGGAAEVWLAQQAAYDLWQARAAAKASKTLSGRQGTEASIGMTGKPDCSDAAAAPALLLWSRLIQALSRAPPSLPCSDINALSPQGPRVSPSDMRWHLPWFYPD
jgi:addiction module HigA family antidote